MLTKTYLPLMLLFLEPLWAVSTSAQTPAPASAAPSAAPAAPTPPPDSSGKDKPKKHGFRLPKIGVDYDTFLPSSGKTHSRFGSSWGGIGIGIGRPDQPSGKGRIAFDFSTQYRKSGDHHAFIAPIGVSYRRAFSPDAVKQKSTFTPYYGFTVNLVPVDLRSVEDNVHSGFRLTYGGSALVGTTIGASGFVEARYREVAKVKGFDLSGIKLSVGVRF